MKKQRALRRLGLNGMRCESSRVLARALRPWPVPQAPSPLGTMSVLGTDTYIYIYTRSSSREVGIRVPTFFGSLNLRRFNPREVSRLEPTCYLPNCPVTVDQCVSVCLPNPPNKNRENLVVCFRICMASNLVQTSQTRKQSVYKQCKRGVCKPKHPNT